MECAQPLFFRFRPATRHPLVSSSRGDAIVPRGSSEDLSSWYATICGMMALGRSKFKDARGAGTDHPSLKSSAVGRARVLSAIRKRNER